MCPLTRPPLLSGAGSGRGRGPVGRWGLVGMFSRTAVPDASYTDDPALVRPRDPRDLTRDLVLGLRITDTDGGEGQYLNIYFFKKV